MKQSLKKEWHSKRNFISYGRIISIKNNLDALMTQAEILPSEAMQLTIIINQLNKLISGFNTATTKTLSFEQYCDFKKQAKSNVKN